MSDEFRLLVKEIKDSERRLFLLGVMLGATVILYDVFKHVLFFR
jgi:hypothetical protein